MQEIQSYKNAETNSLENEIYSLDNQKELLDIDSLSNSTNKDSQRSSRRERYSNDLNFTNLLLKNKNYKIEVLEEYHKNYDLNFKIILIGNIGVGKSCISLKATKGIFLEEYTSTVGFEFYCFNVKIDNKIIKLQIWDTCGQEAYRSLIKNFYRNTSLAIIVYSVEDEQSFNDVNIWLKQVKTFATSSCKIFLIGNKIDTPERQVSIEQGIKCKNDFFFDCFMETSAKEGINTKELFINCATILYEENQNLLKNKNRENLDNINIDNRDSFYLDGGGIYEEVEPCDC
jgi:small GTP-binding protein